MGFFKKMLKTAAGIANPKNAIKAMNPKNVKKVLTSPKEGLKLLRPSKALESLNAPKKKPVRPVAGAVSKPAAERPTVAEVMEDRKKQTEEV